jgi:hypothetical protein
MPPVAIAEIRVEVDDAQSATVDGDGASLRDVVQRLCDSAGVRLIAYEAIDREVSVHYESLPLKDLLPRLLKQESFFVGLRAGSDKRDVRVSTLRVIGINTGETTYAAVPGAPTAVGQALAGASAAVPNPGFQLPPALIRSAFDSNDATQHSEAARYIAENILGDLGAQQRFIGSNIDAIADSLKKHRYSTTILEQVRNGQDDPAVVIKLDQLISSIGQAGR